ncbi:MAG: ATP phosphoribosyltransferase regulatory subunit [Firmicutes bacterium]|nr:ATP phosphoribosyltransferase regulatory subunit [Bacillota bacterium]
MRRQLERPHGTRDFALAEMAHRQYIESVVLRECGQWGYTPVETPLLEYADVFQQGVHEGEEERLYRLFDAHGHTLALRPEMTTPVARLAATMLAHEALPLRLSYSAKTYREQGQRAREAAEITQIGIELLGEGSADGDAEVIALMVGCLRRLKVEDFRIALGHVGYVRAVLSVAPPDLREVLTAALMERDIVAYEEALSARTAEGATSADLTLLRALPRLRGGAESLAHIRELACTEEARAACAQLEDLFAALSAHGVDEWVHLDLGLYPHHEYYTGVVIEGYVATMGQRICYGGRYDELLARFGRSVAATGCVFHLERLQEVTESAPVTRPLVHLEYERASRAMALGFVRDLRLRGYAVCATRVGEEEALSAARTADGKNGIRRGLLTADNGTLQGDELLVQMFAQYATRE